MSYRFMRMILMFDMPMQSLRIKERIVNFKNILSEGFFNASI